MPCTEIGLQRVGGKLLGCLHRGVICVMMWLDLRRIIPDSKGGQRTGGGKEENYEAGT